VIGLGTQADLDAARGFVADTGTRSFPMLWDPSSRSWRDLGIAGQPSGILFTAAGAEIARWAGPIPETRVLELVAGLG
jgi:hypothetical protein